MVSFSKTDNKDLPVLKALWLDCFDEEEEAADLFFERTMSFTHAYKAEENGELIAAVYLVDCTLNGRPAHYLCGAATRPDCRKRGVMSGLIEFALGDAKSRGDVFSVLFPADEGLYRFYSKLGYLAKCTARTRRLTRGDLGQTQKPDPGTPDTDALQIESLKNNFLFWNKDFVSFAASYYGVYGVKTACSKNALVIYSLEKRTATVYYSIYNDIKELKSLLSTIEADTYIITGTGANPLLADAKREICGMLRPLTNEEPPGEVFIGITLN